MNDKVYTDVVFDSSQKVWREFGRPPDLSHKTFINVTFQNVDLSNAQVVGTIFLNVRFINCGLGDDDLGQAASR